MKKDISEYLKKNIDKKTSINKILDLSFVPLTLQEDIDFYRLEINGGDYILIEFKYPIPRLHKLVLLIKNIESIFHKSIVIYYEHLSKYQIANINEMQLSYIIGINHIKILNKIIYVNKIINKDISMLSLKSPSSLALKVFLVFLNTKEKSQDIKSISKELNISEISSSRALNELRNRNMISIEILGKTKRNKVYTRIELKRFIELGLEYFASPIIKKGYINLIPVGGVITGVSALAYYSNMDDLGMKSFAIYTKHLNVKEVYEEEMEFEVEVWKIDPNLYAKDNYINPFLLACVFQNERDERIRISIRNMLKNEYNIWLD